MKYSADSNLTDNGSKNFIFFGKSFVVEEKLILLTFNKFHGTVSQDFSIEIQFYESLVEIVESSTANLYFLYHPDHGPFPSSFLLQSSVELF